MAGIIAHLAIAREILKLLPKNTIENEGLFYAGSIAPDAIHARESFVRAEKKHIHLRDDIPDKDFAIIENLELFHKRVADFITINIVRDDALLDLYRGFVVHILTDELFVLTIRQEFTEAMEELGIAQSDKAYYNNIITDLNRNDALLVKKCVGLEEVRLQLEQVKPYQVEGYLSEKELNDSRYWVINQHYCEVQENKEPDYISYERMLDFIHMAAENIAKRLSEGGNLPRMF